MWLDEQSSAKPLRIPHPKIDKLAYQVQSVGIFSLGEICLRKFDATSVIFATSEITLRIYPIILSHLQKIVKSFLEKKTHSFLFND